MRWRGRIYSPFRTSGLFGRSVVYHGVFGSALFQTMYTPEPVGVLGLLTSLEWHVMFTLSGLLLAGFFHELWPLPVLTLLASLVVASVASMRVKLPSSQRRKRSRLLVAVLYLLQPIVRGWSRYDLRLRRAGTSTEARAAVQPQVVDGRGVGSRVTVSYWNEKGVERFAVLSRLMDLLERDRWEAHPDSGWDEHDVTIYGD